MGERKLELASEFSDILFMVLSAVGLFPESMDAPSEDFEDPGRVLLDYLGQYEDPELGYLEWLSEVLAQTRPELREENFPEMMMFQDWIITHADEMDHKLYAHLKNSLLSRAHQWFFSLKENLISLADAEEIWGLTNLRQNARYRLHMWKVGRNWVTTRTAMRATFGEPQEEEEMRVTTVRFSGEYYYQLRDALPVLKDYGLKHLAWHPDSDRATFHGDVLGAATEALKAGDITRDVNQLIYKICHPDNIIY